MAWALVTLIYFIVGALAICGETQKVSFTKGALILVGWLPLLILIHIGPHVVSFSTSSLVEKL